MMDYKKLFSELTVAQFNEVAENWYARLNKLKDYYYNNHSNIKAAMLVTEMINRMGIVSFLYIQLNKPAPPKKEFESGGWNRTQII
jgi:hypothetical protein